MARQLKQIVCFILVLLLGCCLLTACSSHNSNAENLRNDISYQKPVENESDFYYIDTSQQDLGYIVCYLPANWHIVMTLQDSKLESTIFSAKDESYAYKIPLSYGSGTYKLQILNPDAHVIETTYLIANKVDDDILYTMSNDVVNFNSSELVSKIASTLFKKSSSNYDYLKLATDYAYKTVTYDILQRDTSMFVSVDNILIRGVGVCYEKSKLLTAMLRIKNIPCKLVFGDYGKDSLYHAWCEVYIDGQWLIADATHNCITNVDEANYSCRKVY